MTSQQVYSGILSQALNDNISPGSRLLLMSGTFSSDYTGALQGTETKPIIVLPYQNGNILIDGSIYLHGHWITLQGLHITDSDFTDRETIETGSQPSDIPTHNGIRFENPGANNKAINCIVHDTKEGLLNDITSPCEIRGCLIYNNGWSAPDRGHGHAIYLANDQNTQKKVIDCILHGQFGFGLHAYAEGNDWNHDILKNIYVEGCTMFQNQNNIIGGSGPGTTVRTSTMKSCYVYDSLQIGGVSTGCTDFILQDNVIVGNLNVLYYANSTNPITITGNKFFGTVTIKNGDLNQVVDAPTVFPNNEYLSSIPDCILLRPRSISIFNGSLLDSVSVDVSSLFSNGDTIKVHNAQDYFNDIQTLVVTNGHITISMINHTVVAPRGWTARASTFPQFGCFVLEKA